MALTIEPGEKIFIRTVTNYFVGKVASQAENFIELEDAAWIADTGRFADCLKTGQFREVEPYPDGMYCNVNIDSIVDWVEWPHHLPRTQK